MANAYVLNQTPSGYGAAFSLLVEMLVSSGWTYQASGDGLSGYSATGKVFTNTGTGALGWSNPKAWARLQDPGAGRELLLQHSNAGTARIKYSASAKFTGGSPSAIVTPSAADERYLRGNASDAAPTYGNFFNAGVATGTIRFQGRANDTAPYGFWFAGAATPAGVPSTGFVMDPVTSVPEDPDPVVFHLSDLQAFKSGGLTTIAAPIASTTFIANGDSGQGAWAYMDVAKTQFLFVVASYYAVGGGSNGGLTGANGDAWVVQAAGLSLNPYNGKHQSFPIAWMRPTVTSLAAPLGLKGWSTMMRWTTMARTNFIDTLDNLTWICVGNVWLPWDGVTTPQN